MKVMTEVKNCDNCIFQSGRPEFDLKKCKRCSRTEKALFEPVPTAADLMESFMMKGTYPTLKLYEKHLKQVKDTMKSKLLSSDERRHEFKEVNLVAKFVPKKISDIDYIGLNTYLDDLGLLAHILEIDHKRVKKEPMILEQLKAYQLEPTQYVKPSFNKLGKSLNQVPELRNEGWSVEELAFTCSTIDAKYSSYKKQYETLKEEMIKCEKLKSDKKLVNKYGSVSLINNAPLYDISSIYNEMGSDLLIEYGKPNHEQLQYFMTRGMLTKNDIEQFKTVKDIALEFVVMDLDSERRTIETFQRRQMQAAQNRMRA